LRRCARKDGGAAWGRNCIDPTNPSSPQCSDPNYQDAGRGMNYRDCDAALARDGGATWGRNNIDPTNPS
ncbi:MAG: hypothetical protein ACXVJE_01550, partial [Mucilaginibacter sp.]